jgi:hypothetical protein
MQATHITKPKPKTSRSQAESESSTHVNREEAAGAPTGMPLFLQASFLPGASSGAGGKRHISPPAAPLEHEADQVAAQVLDGQVGTCHCGGTCPDCQQRRSNTLQWKPSGSSHASEEAPSSESDLELGPGQPLSEQARAFFEPRFGQDFSRVRVHTGPQAEESARRVHARAFTTGRDVAFGPGWVPDSGPGRKLLAHELAHVAQ